MRCSFTIMSPATDDEQIQAAPSEMTVYSVSGSARPVAAGPMDPRDAD
jgi:hypothetical protein